jgi:hypothetical protein
LGGHDRVVATQPGELVGERLDLRVQLVVLALQQHRDLTKHLSIADLFDTEQADVEGFLGQHVAQTRQILRKLLVGPLACHPFDEGER